MMGADERLISPAVPVTYRSVANAAHDEEIGNTGNNTPGGDSIGGSRRRRKRGLILGRAWRRAEKWRKARERGEHAFRLVDRGGPFHQSVGRWNIRRLKGQADMKKLIGSDPFHSLVDQSSLRIIFGIIAVYMSLVLVFAIVYTTISKTLGCNLELSSIREGFLFSLETMTTVGYGTNDYLFGTCWVMLPMLSTQACIGLLIDAFLIGILFARLSRPQTRANTVVFTKNAIIRRVRGEAYFMFQVGELRKHQLLETRVRCYALRHERLNCNPAGIPGSSSSAGGRVKGTNNGRSPLSTRSSTVGNSGIGYSSAGASGGSVGIGLSGMGSRVSPAELAAKMPDQVFFQSHSMRLQHPDDELGGNLLLVLPQTVVHRIDAWSPMMPPPRWNSSHGPVQWGLHADKDVVKAPWEEPPSSPDNKANDSSDEDSPSAAAEATSASTAAAAAATAAAEAEAAAAAAAAAEANDGSRGGGASLERTSSSSPFGSEGQFPEQEDTSSRRGSVASARQQCSGYWDDASVSEFGVSTKINVGDGVDDTNKLGYVHRFPDLLKRWDDVDGDRGTWYEKMKRRLMRVEMERRKERDGGKNADEVRAAASRARLARAGFGRPSIMRVGGGGPVADQQKPVLQGSDSSVSGIKMPPASRGDPASGGMGPPGSGSQAKMSAGEWFAREERKAIDAFVQDRELEVVVILEGTDTSTGSTVQARHSYCWEDILWDRTFASCVTRGEDGACEVDFSKFHDTVQAPANCDDHGFIQSYA